MTRQIAHDGADRWVNNVLFRRLDAHPQPPRARHIQRKPVSIRAIRVRPRSDLEPSIFENQPIDFDPMWSIARTIEFWQAHL